MFEVPEHLNALWSMRSHSMTMPHDMYMEILQDQWNKDFISTWPEKSPVRILAKDLEDRITILSKQLTYALDSARIAADKLDQLKLNLLRSPDKVFKEVALEIANRVSNQPDEGDDE